jgi:phosphoribosylaminoimidazole-succinocarboxamide synthase
MSEQVSYSETEQGFPVPTRKERDEAYSSGAGRKAEEHPKPVVAPSTKHAGKHHDHDKPANAATLEAPVGLDLETRGDQEKGSSHCHCA